MKKLNIILSIIFISITIVVDAFIIYQSCLDAGASTQWSSGAVQITAKVINTVFPNTINESNFSTFSSIIRKLYGHFGLFMISGIFTALSIFFIKLNPNTKKLFRVLIVLFVGIILASTTEIIQLSSPGRSGEITDVFIDLAGFTFGSCLTLSIAFFAYHHYINKNV